MKSHLTVIVCCVLLFGIAYGDDLPPGVKDTQNPNDVSLSPRESLDRIQVPDGFRVTLFAAEPNIRRPIAFDFDDRGRLWVLENYSHPKWQAENAQDRIVILEDTDHDGEFDKRKVFWDQGRYCTAIAWGHGGVWVGNTPELVFIPDRNYDDVPDSDPVVKLDGLEVSTNNVINNFHWGPDGWLYGAIGVPVKSFVGPPGTPKTERTMITRGIWRFHPYDNRFEVLARGMVNPWGADFNEVGDLFTTNTVIAHLWHIVPGMYCQRRGSERDNPFAYERIQSITDHLHWSGGKWQDSRVTDHRDHVAGGGHAHCGAMIYLGDNWPDQYRGKFFTGNLHGNRLNSDQFVPRGSTYVGVHRPDFLFANDPWFRSMTQKYGPDGGVFVSDWHDFGECHDKDGSHRSSGRIYKVVYGQPPARRVDLQQLSSQQLVELHSHRNEWLVRHARRLLQERARSGHDLGHAAKLLQDQMTRAIDSVGRLRAIWTLHVIGAFKTKDLLTLASHHDPQVRRWALKLLIDRNEWSKTVLAAFRTAALDDEAIVRLMSAVGLQKMPAATRWDIAKSLITFAEDESDPYLPLLTWYGIAPVLESDVNRSLELAQESAIPTIKQFIARRLVELTDFDLEKLVALAMESSEPDRKSVLAGISAGLERREDVKVPSSWKQLYAACRVSSDTELASLSVKVAVALGDKDALRMLQAQLLDRNRPLQLRQQLMEMLRRFPNGLPLATLHTLVEFHSELRADAIAQLSTIANLDSAKLLLRLAPTFSSDERSNAALVLASRSDFARLLLDSLQHGGEFEKHDVSAYGLQRLRVYDDEELRDTIDKIWPANSTQRKKSDDIARYKRLLTSEQRSHANLSAGRRVFESTCAKCHQLFGEGSDLGPDLTGSGRANLDYVLSNLVDPSGLVDPAYQLTNIVTSEGRVLSGFMVEHTETSVLLRTQEGEVRVSLGEVESLVTSPKSMMPDGMLEAFSLKQIRDLVAYLASPQQVPLSVE